MFVSFFMMLREGMEAALIVGIIASFLKQSGQSRFMPWVWIGSIAAAMICLGFGIALYYITGQLPQRKQELVEAIIGLIAVAMLTYMVFWMKKAAIHMKHNLQKSLNQAINKENNGWWLVGIAFLAVGREGLESAFLLVSVFQQSHDVWMPIGATLGLLVSIIIGVLIYQGGRRINLHQFFNWTAFLLILVAAGLLSGAIRSLHEAGIWNGLQGMVFNWSGVLHEDSPLGIILGVLLGYTDHPSWSDILVWLIYFMIVLFLFLRNNKKLQ